jgi:hypothetical protein
MGPTSGSHEVVAAGFHQGKIKEFFADFDQFPY